ncbi:hypothetical protein Hanom_Chr00s000007g01615741 [Helianthus anomalus]
MLEVKLRKAETAITEQGMIAVAKSQHYEETFKALSQEAKAAINKANEDAQAKLNAAQFQSKQDMTTYREGLKGSVVISLQQARLKMAYEAKTLGFECPSWNVSAWEAKLKDLGGSPVEYPAKPTGEEANKVAEEAANAEKNRDGDGGEDAGGNAAGEKGAAP